jgi:hypothetical protein
MPFSSITLFKNTAKNGVLASIALRLARRDAGYRALILIYEGILTPSQLQAQYGVSVEQDFANLAADNALLVIKKRVCSVRSRVWSWRNGNGWERMQPLAILGHRSSRARQARFEPSW